MSEHCERAAVYFISTMYLHQHRSDERYYCLPCTQDYLTMTLNAQALGQSDMIGINERLVGDWLVRITGAAREKGRVGA